MKKISILSFMLVLLFFSTLAQAEQYRLACKIGPADLTGASFGDKTRFFGKVMDFDVDTEQKIIYSKDLRSETDEVIVHGLWPDAQLIGTFGKQEIAWNNELLMEEDPYLKYKYVSYIEKPSNKKDTKRILYISIQEYKRSPLARVPKLLNKFKHDEMKEKLKKGEITQEEFDKFEAKINKSKEGPIVKGTLFKFKFNCKKTLLEN